MYSLKLKGAVLAVWAAFFITPLAALAQSEGQQKQDITAPDAATPDAVMRDETPPPPVPAPSVAVTVVPPHVVDLQKKLRDHPGQRRARRRALDGPRPEDKARAPKEPRRRPA